MQKSRRVNSKRRFTRLRQRKTKYKATKRYIMKGGLVTEELIKMNMRRPYRFDNTAHVTILREYCFGSAQRCEEWMKLLRACDGLRKADKIKVYILTSGNKIGIIRMLQFMLIDKYIDDVLCTNPDLIVNPTNEIKPEHDFQGKSKYEVIEQIIEEDGIKPPAGKEDIIGYLLDDDEENRDNKKQCPCVQFKNVNRVAHPSEYEAFKQNAIYNMCKEHFRLEDIDENPEEFNFTEIDIINDMTSRVISGAVKVLFLDFDKTLCCADGAIPFQNKTTLGIIEKKGFSTILTAKYI